MCWPLLNLNDFRFIYYGSSRSNLLRVVVGHRSPTPLIIPGVWIAILLFHFDKTIRVSFYITRVDRSDWLCVRLVQDSWNILDSDITHLIAHKHQEFAGSCIIERIDSRNRTILLEGESVTPRDHTCASLFMGFRDPDIQLTWDVCSDQQWEGFDESDQSHFMTVGKGRPHIMRLIDGHDTLVVPDSDLVISSASCDQI